ncbi:MAG TPA: hypothetical protein PLP07_06265 [Pyrinomonadaceae bacterium]|nr:hypothetical protein [Chloracidobacterium sp.]MBP9934508.1 hypothetical protein [Pyrinomonadaceae bacterium]MBK7802490.1 hypothetical protein [Chloracidobacterium sp.]MBK9437360.1 hypothetical protein [Chloracidobacterium sp.]MBK9766091.1 hypothetical protein [Chloracidobacterium sp.]
MKSQAKTMFAVFATITLFFVGSSIASAQFTITIPKIPKIKNPDTKTSAPADDTSSQPTPKNSTNRNDQGSSSGETRPKGRCTEAASQIGWAIDDINEDIVQVGNYGDGKHSQLVFEMHRDDHVSLALSKPDRDKYFQEKKMEDVRNCPGHSIDGAFDALAEALSKKLPTYLPAQSNFTNHNPADEKMIRAEAVRLSEKTILKIGLVEASWLIDTNEIGIPKSRYKHGKAWLRIASDTHQFCHLFSINIIQDYAGAGKYGASYPYFAGDEIVGCPAAK